MGRRIGEKNGICWDLGHKLGIKWVLVGFGSWNWGEKWDLGRGIGEKNGIWQDLSLKLEIKWDLVGFGWWNWDQNGIWVINWGENGI